jgi:hypothetical protein
VPLPARLLPDLQLSHQLPMLSPHLLVLLHHKLNHSENRRAHELLTSINNYNPGSINYSN